MREQRVDFNVIDIFLGNGTLLYYADRIHYRLRHELPQNAEKRGVPANVDFGICIALIKQAHASICAQWTPQRDTHVVRFLEITEQLVPEHSIASQDQDAHVFVSSSCIQSSS